MRLAHTAFEHDSMHAQSTTKPFQSNLSKTPLYENCPKLNDWKNVDSDLKHKCTNKENESQSYK